MLHDPALIAGQGGADSSSTARAMLLGLCVLVAALGAAWAETGRQRVARQRCG